MGQAPCSLNDHGEEEWCCDIARHKPIAHDEYANTVGPSLQQSPEQQLEAMCDEVLPNAAMAQYSLRDSVDSMKTCADDLNGLAWEKWLNEKDAVRAYRFKVKGADKHEVVLSHKDSEWNLWLDGTRRKTYKHGLYTDCTTSDNHNFRLREALRSGKPLDMTMSMHWSHVHGVWKYTLNVNGVVVPECWTRKKALDMRTLPEVPALSK
mmetsp:Transcript_52078/g.123998  ORF Transcript_52078/g.123998 Transcript_52078/m.123998 type:complete len:208 (-) Transcript_52078:61-684(-)|eukprot:CAMPEP_0178401624 /NCGR_PEP_ID=MMETSP0689_2-20121128/16401_1 /TAXON_ID=160604 /ORGANISM="Amphidinium massartii, Strain CS-259" /LENGTH=207 /DNA_ID=CAMNT_0020022457 /DNA_START=53 /DNA_END=676 /DNA_ORIENTATION=-